MFLASLEQYCSLMYCPKQLPHLNVNYKVTSTILWAPLNELQTFCILYKSETFSGIMWKLHLICSGIGVLQFSYVLIFALQTTICVLKSIFDYNLQQLYLQIELNVSITLVTFISSMWTRTLQINLSDLKLSFVSKSMANKKDKRAWLLLNVKWNG